MTQILNNCSPLAHDVLAPLMHTRHLPRFFAQVTTVPECRRVVEAQRPFWAPADPPSDRTVAYVKAQLSGR